MRQDLLSSYDKTIYLHHPPESLLFYVPITFYNSIKSKKDDFVFFLTRY